MAKKNNAAKKKNVDNKYADTTASTLNFFRYEHIFRNENNPFLSFLLTHQHPFFIVEAASERTNVGERESAYIFTFLHSFSPHYKVIDIVFENANKGKATLIFSMHFHQNIRNNYKNIIKFIKSYFWSSEFNKRQKLMKAGEISNNVPQFSLTLHRVAHDDFFSWSSLMTRKLHLYLPTAYGCLSPFLLKGQKLGIKYNDDLESSINS